MHLYKQRRGETEIYLDDEKRQGKTEKERGRERKQINRFKHGEEKHW